MLAWLTFASTALLLAVTAWYAVLTRSLASSARDSARSAQVAAEYAAQSMAATLASVNVKFRVSPRYYIPAPGESILGVGVECAGATVFLHDARILESLRSIASPGPGEEFDSVISDDAGHPLATELELPRRLHEGEIVWFVTEPEMVLRRHRTVATLRVQTRYSLDGIGEGIVREVEWYGVEGIDYVPSDR